MNEPGLIMSTLRRIGFTITESETDAGFVARAERGQQTVEVVAPTRAEAWRGLWSWMWFGEKGYPPRE